MTLPKGKLLKSASASSVAPVAVLGGASGRAARLLKASSAEASIQASAKVAAAEERARAILAAAETGARAMRDEAREEGKKAAISELVAAWVKLGTEQEARDERDLDRTTELARAMAEHLVGETLRLDPAKIQSIAKQVLASARQSKRVVLRAHPEDAAALRHDIGSLGLEGVAIEIQADTTRARGSLLLDTDLGTLDANLTLQLDRLARSLRDSFRS
jgi:flagellar biosynthesis/type III secretory pathway protein FliH